MKLSNLHDVYLAELKDLYSAETQLLKALPRMAKAAHSERLRAAIEEHIAATEQQKNRIEQICEKLDVTPRGKKCKGIQGLIEEGEEVLELQGDPAAHDAALIGAAQRVEHYEIAAYGTARSYARLLGYDDAAELLETSLHEESQTDADLTKLAESEINPQAMHKHAGAAGPAPGGGSQE